ncbi:MAG: hypothetical protein ACK4MV_16265 [Beijerinckiaceae bacterium]
MMTPGGLEIIAGTLIAVVLLILACRYFDRRGQCVDEPYSRDDDYGERL